LDIVAGLGGEEFALLLPETDLKGAVIVAERLRDSISSHVLALQGSNIAVTASMGCCGPKISTHGSTSLGADALRPAAESALREWPVSRRVNRTGVGDDDPTIVEKVDAA
jgi:diguanylate cyclase (GGDEF)-like protein